MSDSRAEMHRIIEAARADGWVLEPDAKRLFRLAGFDCSPVHPCAYSGGGGPICP